MQLRSAGFNFGGTELEDLVALAMENNPDVRSARNIFYRFAALHESESGFFDPDFSISTGYGRWTRQVPWSSQPSFTDDNSITGRAGLEFPLLPGAYVSIGAAEQYLTEPGGGYDSIYRTLVGGQLWIPLARDRGLAQWKARESGAKHRKSAARHALLEAMQKVRFSVELAYIHLLRCAARIEEAKMSAARVGALLDEAEQLVELKVVPSYQLYPARMQVATHKDELIAAENAFSAALSATFALIGVDAIGQINIGGETLLKLAEACASPRFVGVEDAMRARGLYLSLESALRAAESDIKLASEKMKSDFGVSLKATWQGESEDNVIGSQLLVSEEHFGAEAALVWRRPLGFRSERAEIAAGEAASRAISDQMQGVRLKIGSELDIALNAFKSAEERLRVAQDAVSEAENALAAEDDRFRLGEGRSRNVLDAQKDLAAVLARRNNAAAELLQAFANAGYVSGYGTTPTENTDEGL